MATVTFTLTTAQGTVSATRSPTDVRLEQFLDDLVAVTPSFNGLTRAQAAQQLCDLTIQSMVERAQKVRAEAAGLSAGDLMS